VWARLEVALAGERLSGAAQGGAEGVLLTVTE
jgi:hypothetical protein